MYLELTPQDTIKDLRRMLVGGLPKFEFPRFPIYDYEIQYDIIDADKIAEDDFVLGTVWNELEDYYPEAPPKLIVERSYFAADLTPEEIDILASIMMEGWLQTQITSIENTRMKYSGSDFKMTSQTNHLSKLLSLQTECQRQSFHKQRLYKRRKLGEDGKYRSTWSWFGEH